MRKSSRTALFIGILLVLAFVVYSFSGLRVTGPRDKIVQLVLLFPAVLCLAWFFAGRAKRDIAAVFIGYVDSVPSGRFLVISSAAVLLFTSWMAFFPLEGTAKGGDEAAHLFQARIYARGEFAAPAPPVANPERYYPCRHLIIRDGKWFCQYTPTHSFLMAPFVLIGASALLGPLTGVISLLGIFMLVRFWSSEKFAKLTVLLLISSPFFLLMISSHMAHSSNLMFVVWSLFMISLYWRSSKFIYSLAAGILLGLAATTKPFPIIIWGLFIGGVLLFQGKKGFLGVAGIIAGALPSLIGYALLNRFYTGDPFTTPYQLARAGKLLGFGSNKSWFPNYGDYDHTLWRGIKNGIRQVASGATTLFGWPLLSLVPLAAALPVAVKRTRIRWLFLLLAGMFLLLLPHAWPAIIYGPRHYFTFLPVILVLSLLGIGYIRGRALKKYGKRGGSFVFLVLAGLYAITLLLYLPEEIAFKSGPWLAVDGKPRELAEEYSQIPAIVFMEATDHGYPNILSGINQMSPFFDSDIIYCVHQTPSEDLEFMSVFPDRYPYLYFVDDSGSHRIEPWSDSLAARLIPSRDLHPEPSVEEPAEDSAAD